MSFPFPCQFKKKKEGKKEKGMSIKFNIKKSTLQTSFIFDEPWAECHNKTMRIIRILYSVPLLSFIISWVVVLALPLTKLAGLGGRFTQCSWLYTKGSWKLISTCLSEEMHISLSAHMNLGSFLLYVRGYFLIKWDFSGIQVVLLVLIRVCQYPWQLMGKKIPRPSLKAQCMWIAQTSQV